MLVLLADTHGTTDHRLAGRTLEAVRAADRVAHAGDFTTESVYRAFRAENPDLVGVVGNNDDRALYDRLQSVETFAWAGVRFLVTHGHEHSAVSLSALARQEEVDVVVVGHSHRPRIDAFEEYTVVNPGSHADPRRFRPGHVEVADGGSGVTLRACDPAGTVHETRTVAPSA